MEKIKIWFTKYYGFMAILFVYFLFTFSSLPTVMKNVCFLFLVYLIYNLVDFYKKEMKQKG